MRKYALLLLLVALVAVPAARADGDPASDYLLRLQTFVPPDSGISSSDQQQLTSLVTGARNGGYTIRVAIIASQYDMGSVTVLDKKPKLYAHFLSQELRFVYHKRVLVVMANGYGVASNGKPLPAEQKVLDKLALPSATHGAGLAGSAARAVRALALNAGVKIKPAPIVKAKSSGDTTNRDRLVIALAALVVLLLVLGAAYFRKRR